MPKGPIRRDQLVAPFGVGALSVVRDGTSVITCGIDHWYEREKGDESGQSIDPSEFRIEEWRLQRRLGVDHFRLPPDFRIRRRGEEAPNFFLTVPFLRFPKWHFCPSCNLLVVLPLTVRTRECCPACFKSRRKRIVLLQVPFVAMCDRGHLQDFPWREWVHKTANPSCSRELKLIATGGASLAAQRVECDCGAKRTLAQITTAYSSGQSTFLSNNLDESGNPYLCRGLRPWLALEEGEPCASPLRGSLRSASNLYFADVQTALYLPRSIGSAPSDLVDRLQEPPLSTLLSLLKGSVKTVTPDMLRNQHSTLLRKYTNQQIADAVGLVTSTNEAEAATDAGVPGDNNETAFRRAEYRVLRMPRDEEQLLVRAPEMSKYDNEVAAAFNRITLVHKLRETRALTGFTRVFPTAATTLVEKMRLLRRDTPQELWLPAYVVYGEGLFFEFHESLIGEWEQRPEVVERIRGLDALYRILQQDRHQPIEPIVPRFVLLHTIAHLLINRLTFECGYSSAALRERLFVSANPQAPMAGILIYTAAGDAEGTMGGLVRMGKQGNLEPMIRRALESASWCSADPVCMEMGRRGGQGPDSCNLAACHGCALVPETACERFNRFLDRACVVGDIDSPRLGFLSGHVRTST
jgi:hypothetical protein